MDETVRMTHEFEQLRARLQETAQVLAAYKRALIASGAFDEHDIAFMVHRLEAHMLGMGAEGFDAGESP